ncbi:MAG: response regulator [Nostocaceae cyanobacterium]|nr:response regulator [Nostocaceae cyanobacterium]
MNSYLDHTSKKNILVVDDTPDNLRLLSAMLTGQGYEVRKALNGKLALSACQMLLPDLILLDISMPEMDGYEVCQQLKASDRTRHVPVIFISALDHVLDKVRAFEIGGVDYITKPFQAAEVISRIENHLNLRRLQTKLQENNTQLSQAMEDLQKAQLQLIQNEKMVALGQLVAGIAHEINNPISFIYGNLKYTSQYIKDLVGIIQVYQQEIPHPTAKIQSLIEDVDLNFVMNDVQSLVDAMNRGVDRIRGVVLSLQNFSRSDEAQLKQVDIHEGIDNTLVMLQHRLVTNKSRPTIEIHKDYRSSVVTCYPSQLNQVFMHLLNNAIDALEGERQAESHPQIRISTEMTANNTVKICVADNGKGITEQVISRVFDPFFTTKPVGQGTGLGLSISYQIIVQKHQGKLMCHSILNQGSEFIIEIPLHQSCPDT